MSSSVFFRFKSQKEPSRVVFDGTGISVFELKREIISLNRLGDGTDFELVISEEDTNEGEFLRLESASQDILADIKQSMTMTPSSSLALPQSLRRDFQPRGLVGVVLLDMYPAKCHRARRTHTEQSNQYRKLSRREKARMPLSGYQSLMRLRQRSKELRR